jgi:hypothetical protein
MPGGGSWRGANAMQSMFHSPIRPGWLLATACYWLAAVLPAARGQYVDTMNCLQCHQTTLLNKDFCQLVPASVWRQDDKHNRAFSLLHDADTNDSAKAQAKRELVKRILGFELREAFTDEQYQQLKEDNDDETKRKVANVKACLRCHATWPKQADEQFPHTPPVPLELGVSCQACHGPGELWDRPHTSVAWRLVTPVAKARLGCIDTRTTAAKAKLCASCHVGDIAQEKFVKHQWYAAGHPPLPGFDLASFEAQMPMHWRPLREKGAFPLRDSRPPQPQTARQLETQIRILELAGVPPTDIKGSYREANFPAAGPGHDPINDLPRAKDAIVAGAVVLESYVRLMGDIAARSQDGQEAWPELAIFDCAACHHELRSGAGLQNRPRRRHAPGRPPLATWPLVLGQLSAAHAASYEPTAFEARWSPLQVQLRALEQAATTQPFGNRAQIRAAAEPLAASLAQLAADASASPFDAEAATSALRYLTEPANYETNDYATARQAGWAIRAIAADLQVAGADRFFSRGDVDALALTLPSGPDRSVMDNLRRWLPAAANYDAERFRAELQVIRSGN